MKASSKIGIFIRVLDIAINKNFERNQNVCRCFDVFWRDYTVRNKNGKVRKKKKRCYDISQPLNFLSKIKLWAIGFYQARFLEVLKEM